MPKTPTLTLTKQGLLMWRLGSLNFGKQSRWDRAPEKKGMWAFPHPYYTGFFTYHQYLHKAPKRLQYNERLRVPNGTPFTYDDPELKDIAVNPHEVTLSENGWDYKGPLGDVSPESGPLYDERAKWVKEVGEKILPLRKFFWKGEVYTHYNRNGEVTSLDEWTVMDVTELARIIIKTRGDLYYGDWRPDVPDRITPTAVPGRYSHDHFEVFLSPRLGKISGNLKKER